MHLSLDLNLLLVKFIRNIYVSTKIQAFKEFLVPNLDICSNVTIHLMQVEKVCYEIFINLYSYSTLCLSYFVPYFFMEDQEPVLGHYS